jgi:hypothetical protein
MELWNNRSREFKGRKGGFNKLAKERAEADFLLIAHESFRSVNDNTMTYEFGTICAEKPDDDFRDSVLNHAFGRALNREDLQNV